MNYYPFHIGDYIAHTAHLTPIEDIAYRRLLDLYYQTEGALAGDVKALCRLIRMREYEQEVSDVLAEFFSTDGERWLNDRCDSELQRMTEKQTKARASAEASVNARKAKAQQAVPTNDKPSQTNVERTLNERSANVELPTPTPTPSNTSSLRSDVPRKRFTSPVKPDSVSDATWQDFLTLRKSKKAPVTDTALKAIEREADKAGVSLEIALQVCCEAGWQGFNAGWYANRTASQAPKGMPSAETPYQRSMRERVAEACPEIARQDPNVVDFFRTVKPMGNVVEVEAREVERIAK